MRQFGQKDRGLQTVKTAINTLDHVITLSAMPRKGSHPVGQLVIFGHQATGIAVSAQVFSRIKGKCRGIAERAHESALCNAPSAPGHNLRLPRGNASCAIAMMASMSHACP